MSPSTEILPMPELPPLEIVYELPFSERVTESPGATSPSQIPANSGGAASGAAVVVVAGADVVVVDAVVVETAAVVASEGAPAPLHAIRSQRGRTFLTIDGSYDHGL
jgi:hypothetical protein